MAHCYICKDRDASISHHVFPKDPKLKRQWLNFFSFKNDDVFQNTRVCARHFHYDCFAIDAISGRMNLKRGSVPTMLNKRKRKRTIPTQKTSIPPQRNVFIDLSDHNYSALETGSARKKDEFYVPQYFLIRRDILSKGTFDLSDIISVKKLSEPILFGVNNTSTVIKGNAISSEKCNNLNKADDINFTERETNLDENITTSSPIENMHINRQLRTLEECVSSASQKTRRVTWNIINETLSKQKRSMELLEREHDDLQQRYALLQENVKELKRKKRSKMDRNLNHNGVYDANGCSI